MSSLIDKFGHNYLVATFIPSLGFVLLAAFLFGPLIQFDFASLSIGQPLIGGALLLFVFTIILGFTLQGLNTFFYKVLEGYFFLGRFKKILNRQQTRAIRRAEQISRLEQLVSQLERKKKKGKEVESILAQLSMKVSTLKTQYNLDYPPLPEMVLPTRFGNILRSAESYPASRYGMDGVLTWPRLIHVMDDSYYQKLDQSNNGLAFVVNSLLLSFLLGIACLFAAIFQYYVAGIALQVINTTCLLSSTGTTFLNIPSNEVIALQIRPLYFLNYPVNCSYLQEYVQRVWIYLLLALVFFGTTIILYNVSLPTARQYGALIRSSFDLFRFDLLRQLRLPLPIDQGDEYNTWQKWGRLIAYGREQESLPFLYQYASEEARTSLISENEWLRGWLKELGDLEEE